MGLSSGQLMFLYGFAFRSGDVSRWVCQLMFLRGFAIRSGYVSGQVTFLGGFVIGSVDVSLWVSLFCMLLLTLVWWPSWLCRSCLSHVFACRVCPAFLLGLFVCTSLSTERHDSIPPPYRKTPPPPTPTFLSFTTPLFTGWCIACRR